MVVKYVFVMVDQLRMWPFVANHGESVDVFFSGLQHYSPVLSNVTTGNLRTKMVDVPPPRVF